MLRNIFILIICHSSIDLFTGIWPLFKKMAEVDLFVAGLIGTIGGVCGNLLQLVFGQLADLGHRKRYIMLGLVLSSCAALYPYFQSNFVYFILLISTLIGSSSFHPAATGLTGKLAKEKKGMMISLFVAGGSLGLGVSQLSFSFFHTHFNGHTAILLFLPLFCFILCGIYLPANLESHAVKKEPSRFFADLKMVFLSLKKLYFLEVLSAGLTIGFVFLIPEMMEIMNMGPYMVRGGGHFTFVFGTVFFIVSLSKVSDRLGHKNLILLSICLLLPLYYAFFNFETLSFAVKVMLLFSIGGLMGICNPIGVALGNLLMPKNASLVSALLMGAAWAMGNVFLLFVGAVSKTYGVITCLNIIGMIIFISICLACFLPSKEDARKIYLSESQDN